MKYLLAIFTLLACILPAWQSKAQGTLGPEKDRATELWEGKALTAHFRVGICYKPDGQAQGVLVLKHRSGNEDIYHLYGTVKNNEFYLTHSSGHKLSGKLIGPDEMEGKAKLSSGLKLSLSGKRIQNVPLAAPDCAPLANASYGQ